MTLSAPCIEEPLMLFHNTGKSFQDVSAQSGPVFATPMSSRGLALGDFNNDGAVDVIDQGSWH